MLFPFLLLSRIAFCQSTPVEDKVQLTKIYSQAIADFIKAANAKEARPFDTLYFGKHVYGQPDDFPDIQLPRTIEKVVIKLISPDMGEKSQRKSRIYINLLGWVDKDHAEFMFVVFSNGFIHQYDCNLKYSLPPESNTMHLDAVHFKGPPFD